MDSSTITLSDAIDILRRGSQASAAEHDAAVEFALAVLESFPS